MIICLDFSLPQLPSHWRPGTLGFPPPFDLFLPRQMNHGQNIKKMLSSGRGEGSGGKNIKIWLLGGLETILPPQKISGFVFQDHK